MFKFLYNYVIIIYVLSVKIDIIIFILCFGDSMQYRYCFVHYIKSSKRVKAPHCGIMFVGKYFSFFYFSLGNHDTDISIELCQSELWSAFHNLGTEMIITKTGRYVFHAEIFHFL